MRPTGRALLLPVIVGACALPRAPNVPSPTSGVRGSKAALTRAIDSMVNATEFRSANWAS